MGTGWRAANGATNTSTPWFGAGRGWCAAEGHAVGSSAAAANGSSWDAARSSASAVASKAWYKDARRPLPETDVELFGAPGPKVDADEVRSAGPPDNKADFIEFLKRPNSVHALVEVGVNPFEVWRRLPDPAPVGYTASLLNGDALMAGLNGDASTPAPPPQPPPWLTQER